MIRPEIRVLYMSGYTDSDIVRHGGVLNSGWVLLHKPFTARSLGEKVRAVLIEDMGGQATARPRGLRYSQTPAFASLTATVAS
jgi:hypothetical protein